MSHTYAHNLVHCVFSTKDRLDLIRNPDELWRYVTVLAHAKNIHVLAAGGTTQSSPLADFVASNNDIGKGNAGVEGE